MVNFDEQVMGCVMGGAVGDALGAPFEGLWSWDIPDAESLLADFAEFEGYPRGQYTDDTQLTVATLESIVRNRRIEPEQIAHSIGQLWRSAQVVGPGGACMAAGDRFLGGAHWRECGSPIGQAGNGTAMRTAALGLCFLSRPADLPEVVADISRITHHDPRSIAGGVAIASAARMLASHPAVEADALCANVAADMRACHAPFAALVAQLPERIGRDLPAALEFVAWSGASAPEFDRVIITPFVIPTVLAALWAVIRFPNSWSEAVAAAIRLGGDVDTLGAIVGGLMGARLGIDAVPRHLAEGVLDAPDLQMLAQQFTQVIAELTA
jgi:ADP-ribosylglycohydrolase